MKLGRRLDGIGSCACLCLKLLMFNAALSRFTVSSRPVMCLDLMLQATLLKKPKMRGMTFRITMCQLPTTTTVLLLHEASSRLR